MQDIIGFLELLWLIAGPTILMLAIPSLLLQVLINRLEQPVIDWFLSSGLNDLSPLQPAPKHGKFQDWCLRSYNSRPRLYNAVVNILHVVEHVLILAFGYAILLIYGVLIFAVAQSFSYLGLYRRRTIRDRAKSAAKRISESITQSSTSQNMSL